jgi:hypothetical protein
MVLSSGRGGCVVHGEVMCVSGRRILWILISDDGFGNVLLDNLLKRVCATESSSFGHFAVE